MNYASKRNLMHIASLPNDYGIGKLGHEAYNFADFLKKSGQHYWQILPLSQTGYGDSPYQSFSVYAGNPYFISFEMLEENGLLEKSEYTSIKWCESQRYIDYSTLYENVYEVLKKAFERFKKALPLSLRYLRMRTKSGLIIMHFSWHLRAFTVASLGLNGKSPFANERT
jgi:4-alpha-glucanotransferase